MPKKWHLPPKVSDDLITQLLANRGLTKPLEIDKFFNPNLEDYSKDFELSHLKIAHERIQKAIKNEELIIVYGDYDVDGICATAIVYKALSKLGAKILPYIPHREKEGYGLSKVGLDNARELGASLIITVDHGIVASVMADYAKKLGLELIITDHHLPEDDKDPKALAIIHSTKMAGSGVAWCLVRDLVDQKTNQELLELVTLATICDSLPLLDLNRSLVTTGLKYLNKTTNLGLLELLSQTGVELGNIDSYVVGHIIGPRMNAIGRLEHAVDALRLICTKDPLKAKRLADLLNQTNLRRQELTQVAIDQARLQVDGQSRIYILEHKDWQPGIIGLVAGRIMEEVYTPTIAISVGEIHSKGSARSIEEVNIVELIRSCSDILVDVGGHKGAAGFTIETAKLKEFKLRLTKTCNELPKNSEPTLLIDAEISISQITKSLIKDLSKFEPFGFGNPRPLLMSSQVKIRDLRTVGSGKHLKLKVEDIDAIGFGMGEMITKLRDNQLVDIAYSPEINRFNGSETVQLKIRDIQI